MKSATSALFLSLALALWTSGGEAQNTASAQPPATAGTSTLTLRVEKVRNTTGLIRYALFNSDAGWPEDKTKAVRFGSLPANGGRVTFTITGLAPGTYCASVIHDENENHKLDRDLFGRPKEGFGFSGNPKIGFTAPSCRQSQVQVGTGSTESTIFLRYP